MLQILIHMSDISKSALPSEQPTLLAQQSIEEEFTQYLNVLSGDKSISHFKAEFEKMFKALRRSHDSERRLIQRSRSLTQEVISNELRIQAAHRSQQEDSQSIETLKAELNSCWVNLKTKQTSEKLKTQEKQDLRGKNLQLNEQIQLNKSLLERNTNVMLDNSRSRIALKDEVFVLRQQAAAENSAIMKLADENNEIELENSIKEAEISSYRELSDSICSDSRRDQYRGETLKADVIAENCKLESIRSVNKVKRADFFIKTKALEDLNVKLVGRIEELRSEANHCISLDKDLLQLRESNTELEESLETIEKQMTAIEKAEKDITKECQKLESAIKKDITEFTRASQRQRSLLDQLESFQLKKDEIRIGLQQIQVAASSQHTKLISETKQFIEAVLSRDDFYRKLNSSQTEGISSMNQAQEYTDIVESFKIQNVRIKKATEQIGKEIAELEFQLNLTSNSVSNEKIEASQLSETILSKIGVKSNLETELDTLNDHKSKAKVSIDSVRSQRNDYAKDVVNWESELGVLKGTFSGLNEEILRLKTDITEKDIALRKETAERALYAGTYQQTIEKLKRARDQEKKQIEIANSKTAQLNLAYRAEGDFRYKENTAIATLKNHLSERDVLANLAARKNEELALLASKCDIQNIRINDISRSVSSAESKLSKYQLDLLGASRLLRINKKGALSSSLFRRNILRSQGELSILKEKVFYLSENIEDPTNKSRWRIVSKSGWSNQRLSETICLLQKSLIEKIEKSMILNSEFEETDVQKQGLLQNFTGNCGIGSMKEASEVRRVLRRESSRMQLAAAQLHMEETRDQKIQREISDISQELLSLKNSYFDKRRQAALSDIANRTQRLEDAN